MWSLACYKIKIVHLQAFGELAEWSIVADSKSVEPFGVPGVRIPHSPQKQRILSR